MRRASTRQWVLKPQDLAVALKLVTLKDARPSYAALAKQLLLSPFEVHAAVQRLLAARLAVERDGAVWPSLAAIRAFIINGAPYAYPPVRGEATIGFPTAHAVAPLKGKVQATDDSSAVWPHPAGLPRSVATTMSRHVSRREASNTIPHRRLRSAAGSALAQLST
jgi:hypothetical protein